MHRSYLLLDRVLLYLAYMLISLFLSCNYKFAGPLQVSPVNARYFSDQNEKAIYLTGSHTWNNFLHFDYQHDKPDLEFGEYLKFLKKHHHNFIRLWTWELLNWDTDGIANKDPRDFSVSPHPWKRTGPGKARDGKPKFDLSQFDPMFFNRLESRVKTAARAGMYISVMLFEGYGIQFTNQGYLNHPFYQTNNINQLSIDSSQDARLKIHELIYPEVLAIEEKYVRQVVEVLNGYDNILYEISNENHAASTAWQYHWINFIRETEKTLPKQHPVGMTFQYEGGNNADLFNSPADWISPNEGGGFKTDPPVADGQKVIITDTDHLWGVGGTEEWVWRSFFQGMNVIYMDPYHFSVYRGPFDQKTGEVVRRAMGYTRLISEQIELSSLEPQTSLSSTHYCLAKAGFAYLIYFDQDETTILDLTAESPESTFQVRAFSTRKKRFKSTSIITGGQRITLTRPDTSYLPILYILNLDSK